MTGGSVLQFNAEEHKAIYEHLQELPKQREFLSRFRIFYRQADEKEMDCHIKPELQQIMSSRETELELACICFTEFMKDWWQNSHCFLKDTNCKENDPLRKTSEKVKTALVAKILDQRKYEIDELGIEYKETAILDMKQLIEPHQALLIFAPGHTTTLTAAKIHQTLSATEHIMLNLKQLGCYKSEVMRAWKDNFDVMVLECDRSAEDFQDVFNEISMILKECVAKKTFIFISSEMGNIQKTSALRRTFATHLTVQYDDWRFTDIVTESWMFFLEKKVYFQSAEIKLGDIVKENGVGMLNALDSDSAFLLLENEKLSIGSPTEEAVEYYIDRRLQCRKDVNPRSPLQDQIHPALSGDTLQEQQLVSPYWEENLERETNRIWKPSTLLDGEGRVILVTDEPGMGKSTLLTHLAKETRQSHPDTWIVRININNHTSILQEMKTNGHDENGAIKLLTEAAKIKKTDCLLLERRLFHYTYSSTGNMVVLIDGVDEVSPHYTEEVLQILKVLSLTEIKRILVTSRNSMKSLLEEELKCQSYSLVPFDKEDQISFLVKFWNKE
jgi:nucleoside-triphosphatase THEP1